MDKPVLNKPSPDPYENELLGQFLYDLGYCTGFARHAKHDVVCQTQQTPLDCYWADVMAASWSDGVLIEFKKNRGVGG